MAHFHLRIISPERVEFDDDVASLVAPALDGYVGILAGHAPLLTALHEGTLTVRPAEGGERYYRVAGGGFLEVHESQAVALVDRLESFAGGGGD